MLGFLIPDRALFASPLWIPAYARMTGVVRRRMAGVVRQRMAGVVRIPSGDGDGALAVG